VFRKLTKAFTAKLPMSRRCQYWLSSTVQAWVLAAVCLGGCSRQCRMHCNNSELVPQRPPSCEARDPCAHTTTRRLRSAKLNSARLEIACGVRTQNEGSIN
jgi:hypothetical protein